MRPNKLLTFLAICLSLAGCSHGPRLNVCVSNPPQSEFECSLPSSFWHHPKATVLPYTESDGYVVYSPLSIEAVYDYCAARAEAATQAPLFESCEADPSAFGLRCAPKICEVISAGSGLTCSTGATFFVPWSDTENYIGLSPADNQTLLDYCNIKVGK